MNTLMPKGFELNNLQRRYLGLDEVQPHWERMQLKDRVVLYFDGDVIRKKIDYSQGTYRESDEYVLTTENRTMVPPKTSRGKVKKLNFTATESFNSQGVYFYFSDRYIVLGNYTTQTSFYTDNNRAGLDIRAWLDKWVAETTDRNMEELQEFKTSKRVHQKYAEGDFFAFRVGRNKWGFGRILLDITKLRKSEDFKRSNYGLNLLMGTALYIGVYRYLSDTPEVDIDLLRTYPMLPTQAIMDNHFYYGEYRIIGNRPVEPEEWEPPIHYGCTSWTPTGESKAYLQYGLIFKEETPSDSTPYLEKNIHGWDKYGNGGNGFNILHDDQLEEIITCGTDNDSLLWKDDLRKRSNREAKQTIFRHFGLDPDSTYADNLLRM